MDLAACRGEAETHEIVEFSASEKRFDPFLGTSWFEPNHFGPDCLSRFRPDLVRIRTIFTLKGHNLTLISFFFGLGV